MQQNDHFLNIGLGLLTATHDEWGGHHALFLQTMMRMHPMGACAWNKIITGRGAGDEQRPAMTPDTVLGEGRRHPMPMDDGLLTCFVLEVDQKTLPRIEIDTRRPIGLLNTKNRGGRAIDLNCAARHGQVDRRARHGKARQGGKGHERGAAGHEPAARSFLKHVSFPFCKIRQVVALGITQAHRGKSRQIKERGGRKLGGLARPVRMASLAG